LRPFALFLCLTSSSSGHRSRLAAVGAASDHAELQQFPGLETLYSNSPPFSIALVFRFYRELLGEECLCHVTWDAETVFPGALQLDREFILLVFYHL